MGGAGRAMSLAVDLGSSEMEDACRALLPRCDFPPPGSEVNVAVSGGPDSTALLVLACAAGLSVRAVHVDHGMRPESASEASAVAELARRFGASFESYRVVVAAGPNLEARMRAARWSVLPEGTATGHTADDRAETILLNIMRGAGLDGLVAMEGNYHPIIRLRRSETHALCTTLGIDTVADPTNFDLAFRRNRVRHELLPLLDDIARRDVAGILARQADLLAEDAAFLEDLASAIDPTDARVLSAAPLPLARRALRRWLATGLQGGYPPSLAAVERVLDVARGAGVGCEVGQGVSVRKSRGRLRMVTTRTEPACSTEAPAEVAGRAPVPQPLRDQR